MTINNLYDIEHDIMTDLLIDILNMLSKYITNLSKETLDMFKSILMETYIKILKMNFQIILKKT